MPTYWDPFGYSQDFRHVLDAIASLQANVRNNQAHIMATLADVQASLATVQTDLSDELVAVQAAIDDIKKLSDQIASGGVTPAQLDDLKSSLDGIAGSLTTATGNLQSAVSPPTP